MAAAVMARPAMKMVMIAPAPGAAMLSPEQPTREERDPVAHRLVRLPGGVHDADAQLVGNDLQREAVASMRTTKDCQGPTSSPTQRRAVGSRRIKPAMSWRQKKPSMTKTATPKSRL